MKLKSGIYVVELLNDDPIYTNAHDKRQNKQGTLVKKGNIKFGKARDLQRRLNNYRKTFGDNNFKFRVVYETDEIDLYEKLIMEKVDEFRMLSPQRRKLEWLELIPLEYLIQLIESTVKEYSYIKSNYIILDTSPSWIECDGNGSETRVKSCFYACNQHWRNLKELKSDLRYCNICNKEIKSSNCYRYTPNHFEYWKVNRKFVYKNKLHMFYDRQIRRRIYIWFGKRYEYKDVSETDNFYLL